MKCRCCEHEFDPATVRPRHRLICGDTRDRQQVERVLAGEKADAVFTSPPYAVGVDYGKAYEDTLENLRAMLPALSRIWLSIVVPGGFAVVNFGDIVSGREAANSDEPCEYPMAIEYWPVFRAEGWQLWTRRVWCKPNPRVHSPWAIQSNRAASDWEHVWTWKAPGEPIVRRVNEPYQSANGWFDTSSEHGVDVGKDIHGAGMAVAPALRMIALHPRDHHYCGADARAALGSNGHRTAVSTDRNRSMGSVHRSEGAEGAPMKCACCQRAFTPSTVRSKHRIICGDTTDAEVVRRLVDGYTLVLLHADPPYGMGKEADGVANDNQYGPVLDAFQMTWLRTWLQVLAPNGSAYIWGIAPDLWRLWYVGGLSAEPDLIVRNEIVWAKGSGFGMSSGWNHSYPPETERCLFVMRGQQFLGNQNKDDYWDGYEPLRRHLESERDKAGWKNGDVNRLTGTQMAGHWFSKSQFYPIAREHYDTLRTAANGRAFSEPYDDLYSRLFGDVKDGGNAHRRELAAQLRATRTFFDNTHDTMTDVWKFPRVVGAERFGHATPKPVAMVARALLSSSPAGAIVGVPFAGTGPEFIAAEQHSRRAVGAEINPQYCQIVIDRWQAFTGKRARKL